MEALRTYNNLCIRNDKFLEFVQSELNERLQDAVISNNYETVKAFILAGADVNYKSSKTGYSALMYATYFGNSKIVKIVNKAGAHKNKGYFG